MNFDSEEYTLYTIQGVSKNMRLGRRLEDFNRHFRQNKSPSNKTNVRKIS